MSRCPCGRGCKRSRVSDGPIREYRDLESLPIAVNRKQPDDLASGASRLYCYWKIAFYHEIARKDIEVYVPPEWRFLSNNRLTSWVNRLRDHPFEDIVLGRVTYLWAIDILMPRRQDYGTVPIPGRNGWPNNDDSVPYWGTPRVTPANGIDKLKIFLNRPPLLPSLGMGRLVCYWRMRLTRASNARRYAWVPPEWRLLTVEARAEWARQLADNPDEPIVLGETFYYWDGDTIVPRGQNPLSIEYYGYGRYKYFHDEDVELQNELNEDRECLNQIRTSEGSQSSRNRRERSQSTNHSRRNIPGSPSNSVYEVEEPMSLTLRETLV